MKILLLTTHLNIGGVAVYVVNLAKGLKKRGVSAWIASSGGELAKGLRESGIPHFSVRLKTKFEFNPKLIFAFFKLRELIKKNKIDVIHAHTRVTQVLAYFLSKTTGAKFVSTCHGYFKAKRLGRKLFGAWGETVIAISDAVKDHLIKDFRVSKDRVALIYTGVHVKEAPPVSQNNTENILKDKMGFAKSPVIGTISRLSPVKGLRYLLFAMKDLLKEIPEAQLLLVGDGPSKSFLVELAGKLGIEKNVFFAHSTTDIQRFLAIIDVFVFYSLKEGLGLSLLEALAAGKPCVASNVGGVSSIIEDGVSGILVPPKDTHMLKEAITKVLSDRALSARLAEDGKKLVKEKFSFDRMLGEIIDVYKK